MKYMCCMMFVDGGRSLDMTSSLVTCGVHCFSNNTFFH